MQTGSSIRWFSNAVNYGLNNNNNSWSSFFWCGFFLHASMLCDKLNLSRLCHEEYLYRYSMVYFLNLVKRTDRLQVLQGIPSGGLSVAFRYM